jgi:hypothetical protein
MLKLAGVINERLPLGLVTHVMNQVFLSDIPTYVTRLRRAQTNGGAADVQVT